MRFVLSDICQVQADCIVNPSDTELSGGGGVDRAIHREAGRELDKVCKAIGSCQLGGAVVTEGFELSAKYIIHTAVPDRNHPSGWGPYLLAACYVNAMNIAAEKGVCSIVFPAMGTGLRGFSAEESARIAIRTLEKWCRGRYVVPRITFVFRSEQMRRCYQAEWERCRRASFRETVESFRELCSPETMALLTAHTMPFHFAQKGGYVTLPEDQEKMANQYSNGWYKLHEDYSKYMMILYEAIGSPNYQNVMDKALRRIGHTGPGSDRAFLDNLEKMDLQACVCFLVLQQRKDYWSGGVDSDHLKLCASGDAYRVLCRMKTLLEDPDIQPEKEDWSPVHN